MTDKNLNPETTNQSPNRPTAVLGELSLQPKVIAKTGCLKFICTNKRFGKAFRRGLGALMHDYRISRNMTLAKVSEKTGLKIDVIDRIEIGKKEVLWPEANKLFEFYEVTLVMCLVKQRHSL